MGFRIDENFANKIDFIELPVEFQSGAITTVFRRLADIRVKKESNKIAVEHKKSDFLVNTD